MRVTRSLFLALLAAGGFALAADTRPAPARQKDKDEPPQKPSNLFNEIGNYRSQGIVAGDLPKAKAAFEAFAKYHGEVISHPRVYSAPQEFAPAPTKSGTPVPTLDGINADLSRLILVPDPPSKIGTDQADYIRELGAALDAELGKKAREGDMIVRVNAARLLATAARSGATPHYPTVTALVANANTPAAVKYWAFQAAANLLAAYNLNDYQSRAHSGSPEAVAALIKAIEAAVQNPSKIEPLPMAPAGQPAATYTPDQVQSVTFIRRQAVRALAQVRFAEMKVKGGETIFPSLTLARIATGDPTLVPASTSPLEVAEAVIGLCNMTPPRQNVEAYGFAAADAVSTGIYLFAFPKVGAVGDRTIAWKGTAARINDALKGWRPLWDGTYNPTQPNSFDAGLVPKPVADVIADADRLVLTPMEKADPGAKIDIDKLKALRQDLRANKKWTLAPFKDNPKAAFPQRD